MRIRIKGEVTPEMLGEALRLAKKQYEILHPECLILGANIYFSAYDLNGEPFDVKDGGGNSLFITLENPGKKRHLSQKNADSTSRDENTSSKKMNYATSENEISEMKRMLEEHESRVSSDAEYIEVRESQEAHRKKCHSLNEAVKRIMRSDPEGLVVELNKIIESKWASLKPVIQYGKGIGDLLPMPSFSTINGNLMLYAETWIKPRKVFNPIGGWSEPHWRNQAWQDAAIEFDDLICKLDPK